MVHLTVRKNTFRKKLTAPYDLFREVGQKINSFQCLYSWAFVSVSQDGRQQSTGLKIVLQSQSLMVTFIS